LAAAATTAGFTFDVHVGQEVHLDAQDAITWQASQRPPLMLKEWRPAL
jgi:hypothetical protein